MVSHLFCKVVRLVANHDPLVDFVAKDHISSCKLEKSAEIVSLSLSLSQYNVLRVVN